MHSFLQIIKSIVTKKEAIVTNLPYILKYQFYIFTNWTDGAMITKAIQLIQISYHVIVL